MAKDRGDLQHVVDAQRHPRAAQGFDRLLTVQRPVVLAHIRSIRARKPQATPAEIIHTLEVRYLAAVTGGGAAVGAASAIPAVGVGASIALSGVETAGFLEASALFAQSVTEVHGIASEDPERSRTLVMTLMLGSAGSDLVRSLAGQAAGNETRGAFWGELVTSSLPKATVSQIAERLRSTFIKRVVASQGASAVGRAIPFGIGAVVGGAGNHILGRKIVSAARDAFGAAPLAFPAELAVTVKPAKPPRTVDPRVRKNFAAASATTGPGAPTPGAPAPSATPAESPS